MADVARARADLERALALLSRVAQLMEPRMTESGVSFEPAKMAFFEQVDGKAG